MKSKKPRPIQELLHRPGGIRQLIQQAQSQRDLLQQIARLLPEPLNRHTSAALLKGRQLLLYCDSPAWASRLRFQSRDLRNRLQQQGRKIDKVTVRITPQTVSRRRKPQPLPGIPEAATELLQAVADGIQHQPLREALQRLSRHQR